MTAERNLDPLIFDDEPHGREFSAQLRRRAGGKGIGAARTRKHRGRSLAALAVAVAVPAMAAPDEWRPFTPQTAEIAPKTPMAFETPGESFPGSAFYYMADEPHLLMAGAADDLPLTGSTYAALDTSVTNTGESASLAEVTPRQTALGAFAAANPLLAAGSLTDRSRAQQCLTMALYYEARSEPEAGQRAVAQVVLNRVKHPSYPNTVCGVVFQGSQRRTGCQFSFTCDGSMRRQPASTWWNRSRRIAQSALSGAVYRPVGLATHYHTVQIYPYWAPSLARVGTIGAHHFYRFKGSAGKPSAFRTAYVGREPAAKASAVRDSITTASVDPVEVAQAYEKAYQEALKRAQAQNAATAGVVGGSAAPAARAAQAPAPSYSQQVQDRGGDAQFTAQNLPGSAPKTGSGSIREEYAQSGQWIGDK